MPWCRSECAMSTARRRFRVSGIFALITQKLLVRRYQFGCAEKKLQARGRDRKARKKAGASRRGRLSKE